MADGKESEGGRAPKQPVESNPPGLVGEPLGNGTNVYPNGEGEKLKPKPGTRGSVNQRTRLRKVKKRPIK
jgi:hypothetical protein